MVSPPYVAVIEWLPTASVEVVKMAEPPGNVALPIWVLPSKYATVPVGEFPVTVAVNVTDWLKLPGFGEEARLVVVVVAAAVIVNLVEAVLPL